MTVLDINNVVNVSISSVPQGISGVNMNSVCFLTTETPDNLDLYREYINARDVATDYGTESETYAMANALFSQTPNILSGGGRLVIVPMIDAVSATQGQFVTANISSNVTALTAVSDGDLRVVLNGTNIDLTNVNLTGCSTLADIATVLSRKLPDALVSASSTAITVKSKKTGADSTVELEALSGGTGTNLAAAGMLNTASGTSTDGEDSSGETILEALDRAAALVQFVGFFTNLHVEDAVYLSTANSVQSLNNIWVNATAAISDIQGVCTDIGAAGDTKTKCLVYTFGVDEANLMCAAYVGRAFSVNFSGSNTFITMNLKPLATILPDTGITQTIYTNAKNAGVDTYDNFGIGAVTSTKYGSTGLYFDEIYANLWLQFALQTAGFNYLASTSGRVPQTEAGMNGLASAYIAVLQQGVTVGVIGTGLTWNSSETFGDPESLRASVTAVGYYVYWQPIAQQSQVDRAARIAPVIQMAIKRAGAIQHSDVLAFVEA